MKKTIEKTVLFVKTRLFGVEVPNLPYKERVYRYEHSLRVANLAKHIAEQAQADVLVCVLAALLHDVGKFDSARSRDHGRVSALIAKPFLDELTTCGDITQTQAEEIHYAVAVHVDDDAGYPHEHTIEAEIVSDCDNIDRVGKLRIKQDYVYDLNKCASEQIGGVKNRIEELKSYSQKTLSTPLATQMWRNNVEYQISYYTALYNELGLVKEDIFG